MRTWTRQAAAALHNSVLAEYDPRKDGDDDDYDDEYGDPCAPFNNIILYDVHFSFTALESQLLKHQQRHSSNGNNSSESVFSAISCLPRESIQPLPLSTSSDSLPEELPAVADEEDQDDEYTIEFDREYLKRNPIYIKYISRRLSKYYRIKKYKIKEELNVIELQIDKKAIEFIINTPKRGVVNSAICWLLKQFYSPTDSLGMLNFGKMHVLSLFHTFILLNFRFHKDLQQCFSSPIQGEVEFIYQFDTLLDIGAGNGTVTKQLSPLFKDVVTTETSVPMVNSLIARGFKCIHTSDPSSSPEIMQLQHSIDVITCLNVLDRCSRPLSLLSSLKNILISEERKKSQKGAGVIILAVVFPFEPYVENGTATADPEEVIDLGFDHTPTFEESANAFYDIVLKPLDFQVHSVSKLPYISEGDYNCEFYVLTDAIFVISPTIK